MKEQFFQIQKISDRARQRCQLIGLQIPKSYESTSKTNAPDFRQSSESMSTDCTPNVLIKSMYKYDKFTRHPIESGKEVN